jgi:hypothetical protein
MSLITPEWLLTAFNNRWLCTCTVAIHTMLPDKTFNVLALHICTGMHVELDAFLIWAQKSQRVTLRLQRSRGPIGYYTAGLQSSLPRGVEKKNSYPLPQIELRSFRPELIVTILTELPQVVIEESKLLLF